MDTNHLELDTYSVVTSLHDTISQTFHRDVNDLFRGPRGMHLDRNAAADAEEYPLAQRRPHGIVAFHALQVLLLHERVLAIK